jgi:hypothetical protein
MFVRVEKTGEFEKEKRRLEVKQESFVFWIGFGVSSTLHADK